jgi:hypothetical protein
MSFRRFIGKEINNIAKELNFDEMVDYIVNKTGIDRDKAIEILDKETDYLIKNGFAVIK